MEERWICDTHAHYDDEAFDVDREFLLQTGLKEAGVEFAVNMGASMKGAEASAELSERYDVIYAGCGIHPDDVGVLEHDKGAMSRLTELCRRPKTVCVGEIGLDYHWMVEEKEVQRRWFRAQMRLAYELGLPINVHSRNAAQETYDLIRENYEAGQATGGVIHCYSGSRELAREYVKMGYHLGIGGVITFKNAKTLVRVVEDTPVENLVTETDCPYLAPEPNRGKRNDSRNIRYVIRKIAELKGMEEAECAQILRRNAHEVYRIPD